MISQLKRDIVQQRRFKISPIALYTLIHNLIKLQKEEEERERRKRRRGRRKRGSDHVALLTSHPNIHLTGVPDELIFAIQAKSSCSNLPI